jgi:hypothetical protein
MVWVFLLLSAAPNSYGEARSRAVAEHKPLICWIGQFGNEGVSAAQDLPECLHVHLGLAQWRQLSPKTPLIDTGIIVIDRDGWMRTLLPKRCRGGVALAPGQAVIEEIRRMVAVKPDLTRYFELRDSAVQQKKNLIVWVGSDVQRGSWLPMALALQGEAVHVFADSFPGCPAGVVVGRWNGSFHERTNIVSPTLANVRAALQPPPDVPVSPVPPIDQPTLLRASQAWQPAFQRGRSC